MERFYHYLKANESVRMPRRHIFLDSEAHERTIGKDREQTFRVAVARYWTAEKGKREYETEATYSDAGSLWCDVDRFCRPRTRTVLWAHNLGYDARIVECLTKLPLLGWTLLAHNFASRGTWLQWRKGDTSLTMVDSASVFGTTLAKVGEFFGKGKPVLPDATGSWADWVERCRADVDILATATKAYLSFLESGDLGTWQHTGAGQSWAAFRHRFLTHQILVHDDAAALVAERRAMWAGRCEAYWHGTNKTSIFHEWDLTLAYARIARDCSVPIRLLGPLPHPGVAHRYLDNPTIAVLAHCEVSTDVPVVPALVDNRIAWPVGTFSTTLWDAEIREAQAAGATVTITDGWLYRTAPALQQWGAWIIEQLGKDDSEVPAWQKLVLKHWARALIGRFAMTYTEWEHVATAEDLQTRRLDVYDFDSEQESEMLQVGRELFEKSGTVEWRDSCPMITSYIMSVARVRLWRIIQACPPRSVRYVDTDSIVCDDTHHDAVKAVADSQLGNGLRLKKSWRGLSVWGPRQIVTGPLVRVAGLPKGAHRIARDRFVGEVWESLEVSLRRRRPDRVVIANREWRIRGTDRRRDAAADGWTTPRKVGSPS